MPTQSFRPGPSHAGGAPPNAVFVRWDLADNREMKSNFRNEPVPSLRDSRLFWMSTQGFRPGLIHAAPHCGVSSSARDTSRFIPEPVGPSSRILIRAHPCGPWPKGIPTCPPRPPCLKILNERALWQTGFRASGRRPTTESRRLFWPTTYDRRPPPKTPSLSVLLTADG